MSLINDYQQPQSFSSQVELSSSRPFLSWVDAAFHDSVSFGGNEGGGKSRHLEEMPLDHDQGSALILTSSGLNIPCF